MEKNELETKKPVRVREITEEEMMVYQAIRKYLEIATKRYWNYRNNLGDLVEKRKTGKVGIEVTDSDLEVISREVELSKSYLIKMKNALHRFIDDLTEGRYMNPLNVSHSVGALDGKRRFSNFNFNDRLDPKILEDRFYFSANGNQYVEEDDFSVLVIFSPKNEYLRRLVGMYGITIGHRTHNIDRVKLFAERKAQIKGKNKFNQVGVDWAAVTLEKDGERNKTNLPKLPRWSDIADCVVDIDNKQVLFYS